MCSKQPLFANDIRGEPLISEGIGVEPLNSDDIRGRPLNLNHIRGGPLKPDDIRGESLNSNNVRGGPLKINNDSLSISVGKTETYDEELYVTVDNTCMALYKNWNAKLFMNMHENAHFNNENINITLFINTQSTQSNSRILT